MEINKKLPKICLAATVALLLVVDSKASEIPTLDQIVSNAVLASTATKSYQASVTQTIFKETDSVSPKADNFGTSTSHGPSTTSFLMRYNPGEKLTTQDIDPQEQPPATESFHESQNELGKNNPPGANLRFTVNINHFLVALQSADQVAVAPEVLDGRQVYKISADFDNGTRCFLSIDAENWYVSEIIIDLFGTTFSHIILTHRNFGNYWLPSAITLFLPIDGSEVIQQLDYYLSEK